MKLFFIPDHIILPYILPDIEPESQNKVDDNRRSKRKKGKIDKVQSDFGSGNSKLIADIRTNTKDRSFNKRFKH